MRSAYCLLILLVIVYTHPMMAQGLDASPAGVMISHGHPKGGWMISYTYMNMLMKDNLSGTEKVSDEDIFIHDYGMSPQQMQMDMHMLMMMYGLTGRLSTMLMAVYNNYSMDMKSYSANHVHGGSTTAEPSLYHSHQTSGLGDMKLWMLYKLLDGEGSSLVFSMGVNLPTGNYKISAGEHATFEGERQSYMMQMGTGAYDLMPGLTYYKKSGKTAWSVQALGNIRPFNNSVGYHYGNDLTANAWGAYQFNTSLSASLRAEIIYGEKISGKDPLIYQLSEPASNPENYGGTRISSFAGINYYINKNFMRNSKLSVEFGMPFYQDVNGYQMAVQYSFSAGITKSF